MPEIAKPIKKSNQVKIGLTLLFFIFACSGKDKAETLTTTAKPDRVTTLHVDMSFDKIIIQNTEFNWQTDEPKYQALVLNQIKLFIDNGHDMGNFEVQIKVHNNTSRKQLSEFDNFLRRNNVFKIFYKPAKARSARANEFDSNGNLVSDYKGNEMPRAFWGLKYIDYKYDERNRKIEQRYIGDSGLLVNPDGAVNRSISV